MNKTFEDCIRKIESYKKGFTFTIHYNRMDEKTHKAMAKVMDIAEKRGLVEGIEIGAGWDDDGSFNCFQNVTYVRR